MDLSKYILQNNGVASSYKDMLRELTSKEGREL